MENEKNTKNPNTGQNISFISSQQPTEQIKTSLARLLNKTFQGNRKIIKILTDGNRSYPHVRDFLEKIVNPHNFIQ